MAPRSPAGRGRGLARLALPLGSVLLLAATASLPQSPEEALVPGQARERPIAAGEAQTYRISLTDAPLLVTVDQRGIDLVVEVEGPAGRTATDTGEDRWGLEVLLLESPGEYHIE